MRKRILAVVLTIAMCTMMSSTVFAASSSTSGSSSSGSSGSGGSGSSSGGSSASGGAGSSTATAVKGTVNTDTVFVASKNADGTVSKVNLTQYTQRVESAVVSVAASSSASGTNAGEAVSAVLTTPASEIFKATINALGGHIRLVNAGGYKVVATSSDGAGKTIASVGTIQGVTKYAYVILTAVNADGTIEIVEGTVDPVSLQVMGAFVGTPASITVSVIMAAS